MADHEIVRTTNLPTEESIIDLISWALRIPSSQIFPYTHLEDDLHLDTIDQMLLIAQLEARFNVILTTDEVASIETVKDASAFFLKRFAA